MKITKEIKELAKEIHKKEHIFVNGKIDSKHKLEDFYYLLGSLVLTKVTEQIKDSNVELFNKIVDLESRFKGLENSLKEVSKQQKYLWQTLEESAFDRGKVHQ